MISKTYRIKPWARVLITLGCLFFSIGFTIFIICNKEATILQKLVMLIGILIFIDGAYVFNNIKATIDNDKIEIPPIKFLPRTGVLYWDEIVELRSEYLLFPEAGIINLIPKHTSKKTPLRISIYGMPITLVQEILSHLSSDVKIYLYPYLKQKLNNNP